MSDESHIEYEYDALNRLTKEAKYKEDKWGYRKHLIYSYEYTFDAVGNRLTMRRNLHQPLFWGCMNDDLMDDLKKDLCHNGFDRPEPGNETEDDSEPDCKCFNREPPLKPSILTRYTYNEENQLLLEEEGIEWKNKFISLSKTEYLYDNNGNQVKKTVTKGVGRCRAEWVTNYEYDYDNRLIKITYPEQGKGEHKGWDEGKGWDAKVATTQYEYDGVGKRIKTIEGKEITKYFYDGLSVIIERDEDNKTIATYNRGLSYGGGIGGIISSTRQKREPPHCWGKEIEEHCDKWNKTLTNYYHYDGLGSVTSLTSSKGQQIATYQYDAYGNVLKQTGLSYLSSYQFSTKEYSSKSGLSYFGARYYDSTVGRFITPDLFTWRPEDIRIFCNPPVPTSLNPQIILIAKGKLNLSFFTTTLDTYRKSQREALKYLSETTPRVFHRYSYCNNNPINYLDPYGLREKKPTLTISQILDLVAVGGDAVSFIPTPYTVVGGFVVSLGGSVIGTGYTIHQYKQGEATKTDVGVSIFTTITGAIPWVGIIPGIGQLIYDSIGVDP